MSTAVERGTSQLLAAQAAVLEQIVRGQPLLDVLGALCNIVETQAGAGVRAAIELIDAEGKRLQTCALAEGLRAAWSMPILSSTGSVLGTFGTYFLEQREPSAEEIALVEVLARTAALAIERQRSDDELRRRVERAQFLDEVAMATRSLSEPRDIMQMTARLVAEHLGADRCAYASIEDERVFVITGDYTRGVPSIVGRWDVAAFGPACVAAMHANEPYVVEDSAADPRIDADQRAAYEATTIRAVICVPLHKDGVFTAAMAVHQMYPRAWTAAEIELVSIVVQRCWEVLERARLARSLRDSEALYRAIVEASPECVKLVAADGTLLQMNAAGINMIEADGDPAGACVYDVIAPEHRERFRAFNERVCRGEGGQLAFDIIGLRGTRRTMETTAVPLSHPHGGYTQLALTRDVSERVRAERALDESRARLEYAVRLSGVGFWYCDLPFDELAWDERVKDHFFLPPDARVTIDLFYERIHPEDRVATRTAIDHAIDSHASYDVVYRTVDPVSGAIKYIRALGGAAYAPDGTPVRFDGVTVDVSAEREQDRRKDEFLATLAHELRNPLAPIRTGLQILQRGGTGEQADKVRAMMERQLGHLVRLVDDLLDISRITLGKITLERTHIDLRAVLDSALETTRPLVESGGHELAVELPVQPLQLDVDPTRLAQVFANLVNNAAKYTPDGGRISITAEVEGGFVCVRVRDTGVGIPEDMLGRVFDMFTQVGHSIDRSQGGLGIGLTLVRRLVEMHGGTVEAHSAGAGHGTTVTVRLPLAQAATATVPSAVDAMRAAGNALRVLVVDDNVDGAETLAMLLEFSGNVTRMAHTGPDALAAAGEFQPDLVFLDIGLPGFDGYEVARRMRADRSLRQPMLVALTGWGSEDDRKQAAAAGFDRHLVKPIDASKLDDVLAAVRT